MIDNRVIKKVHISEIKVGDIIIDSEGIERTVCSKDIHYDKFIGKRLFGSTYCSGLELVDKVMFNCEK